MSDLAKRTLCLLGVTSALLSGGVAAGAEERLSLRMENFIVTPSTGPVANVTIRNLGDEVVDAVVDVEWPNGWKAAPAEQKATIAAKTTATVAFTIEKAVDVAANRYNVVLRARTQAGQVTRRQQVVCATAPYLKPAVDGALDDWQDAVPLAFVTEGRGTTVMTAWNRKQFLVAVRVEESHATAVQFAVTPGIGKPSGHYEIVVLTPPADGPAKVFLVSRPGKKPAPTAKPRPLAKSMELVDGQAIVRRQGDTISYEIALPMKQVEDLQATAGRPFQFSLLVHDAQGLRDLGTMMGFSEDRRNAQAWFHWQGAEFGSRPPFDSQAEFAFSSSIH